jgi:hypothetical protein
MGLGQTKEPLVTQDSANQPRVYRSIKLNPNEEYTTIESHSSNGNEIPNSARDDLFYGKADGDFFCTTC